jgi:hypothetical protein
MCWECLSISHKNVVKSAIDPDSTGFERIQDLIYVIEKERESPESLSLLFIVKAEFVCAAISVRIPNFDEIKTLSLDAFTHFLLPLEGEPSFFVTKFGSESEERDF